MAERYNQDGIIVRDSIQSDVEFLKDRLRQSDIEEIWASHNHTPEEALQASLDKSLMCYTVLNGRPLAMFGVNPDMIVGQTGVLWCLGTDGLNKISRRFVRRSREFIQEFLKVYSYLYNYVDDRNQKSIEWLRWCGATIEEPMKYGVEGRLFRYFYFRR